MHNRAHGQAVQVDVRHGWRGTVRGEGGASYGYRQAAAGCLAVRVRDRVPMSPVSHPSSDTTVGGFTCERGVRSGGKRGPAKVKDQAYHLPAFRCLRVLSFGPSCPTSCSSGHVPGYATSYRSHVHPPLRVSSKGVVPGASMVAHIPAYAVPVGVLLTTSTPPRIVTRCSVLTPCKATRHDPCLRARMRGEV